MNKYQRKIVGVMGESAIVDVYDVLIAYDVRCPAIAHAIKKLLVPGSRGAKSWSQDVNEAIGSLRRALDLQPSPSKIHDGMNASPIHEPPFEPSSYSPPKTALYSEDRMPRGNVTHEPLNIGFTI